MEQSRAKWLSGVMFQKYWTKTTKKKSVPEGENPPKESMAKIGTCRMIVDPHIFEVTLYAIRENVFSAGPVTQPSPYYETPRQHESPYGNPSQPSRNPGPPVHTPVPTPKPRQDSRDILPPFREGFAQYDPSYPSPAARKPGPPPSIPQPQHHTSMIPEPPKPESSMHADPVIQMLASRASSDPVLKALMKDVAAGIGTPSQLKTFQSHIDELHEIIKRDNGNKPVETMANASQAAPTPANTYGSPYANGHTMGGPINSRGSLYSEAPVKSEPNHSSPYAYLKQPPAPIPKYKPPSQARQETTGIAFDFTAGNGDRFLIPKDSILEYLPSYTSVIVSFLHLFSSSDEPSANVASNKANRENASHYQPITIQLEGNSKHLEQLAKVVKPQEEVVKYMDDIMDRKKRAKTAFLALKLPKKDEVPAIDRTRVPDVENQDVPQKSYEAPDFLTPMYTLPLR